MSTTLHGGKPASQRSAGTYAPENGTIAAGDPRHDPSAESTATHVKMCCVCGANVANERRYKDADGRYWCCECAKSDSGRKHPVTCPDCGQAVPAHEVVEFEGKSICPGCIAKRQAAAKRAAARLAAAEEESRQQRARQHRILIGTGVVVGLLVVYAAVKFWLQ